MEEKTKLIIIDLKSLFRSIKEELDGKEIDFNQFYFDLIRNLAGGEATNVYIYIGKIGNKNKTFPWEMKLDDALQALSAKYPIYCEKKIIKFKNGTYSQVEIVMVRDITEAISNEEERDKISEVILISNNTFLVNTLKDLPGKYGVNMTVLGETNENITRTQNCLEIINLREFLKKFFTKKNK